MEQITKQHFVDNIQANIMVADTLADDIEAAGERAFQALVNGGRIIVAADSFLVPYAQHLSYLLLCGYRRERPALPSFCLNQDAAINQHFAALHGSDLVLAQKLKVFHQPQDLLLVLAATDSVALANTIKVAHEKELEVVAMTGEDHVAIIGELVAPNIHLQFPTADSCRIADLTSVTLHSLCDFLETKLFPS